MKQDGSNFGTSFGNDASTISLRSEAQLQGVGSDVVWLCGCYSKDDAAAPALDGTWTNLIYLPIEDASTNPMLRTFVKYVGRDNADQFAVYPWAATMEFRGSREGRGGEERRQRADPEIAAHRRHPDADHVRRRWDDRDDEHPTKVPSPCFVLMQLKDGKYVRETPAKKGTLDCNPKNAVSIKADYIDN